jgi:adenylylsulfate kinase-like enzyme
MGINNMTKTQLKNELKQKTGCTIQYTGWPCGTCFFAMSKKLTNKDWQSLLLFRGDYKKEDLNNLPKNVNARIEKIHKIAIG